jgi:hypothetical protein
MDEQQTGRWAVVRHQKFSVALVVARHTSKQAAQEQMRRLRATVPFPYDRPGYYTVRELPDERER